MLKGKSGKCIQPVKEVNKLVQSTPGFLQISLRRFITASLDSRKEEKYEASKIYSKDQRIAEFLHVSSEFRRGNRE